MAEPESISAVAVVVDCSLAISHEWYYILNQYLPSIIQRIHGTTQGASQQCRLALITYSTASNRPSPIVSKLFFQPLRLALGVIRDDPDRLGLGSVASCGRGAAVLEAMVAATEMFDALSISLASTKERKPLLPQSVNQSPPKRNVPTVTARHIIHIADLPPDGAKRPLRNTFPSLDNTTWDTLPEELRKRDINWSMIMLQQSSTRLAELHSKVEAKDIVTPWFPTSNKHSLLLVGFPQKATKRPGDPPTTPEPKRVKIKDSSGTHSSPNNASASPSKATLAPSPVVPKVSSSPVLPPEPPAPTSPAPRPQLPASNITPSQPPPQPQPRSTGPQRLPPLEQVEAGIKAMEREIMVLRSKLPELEGKGAPEVQAVKMRLQQSMVRYTQLRGMQKVLKERQAQGQGGGSLNADPSASSQTASPFTMAQSNAPPPDGQSNHDAAPSGLPMGAHLMHGAQGAHMANANLQQAQNPASQMPGMPPTNDPNLQMQMQKLLHQRNNSGQQNAMATPQPAANQGQDPPGPRNARLQWFGRIVWELPTLGEVSADINVLSPGNLEGELWPRSMKVKIMPMPPKEDMQSFLKDTRAAVCVMQAMEPADNRRRFTMFMQALLQKNAYASYSWPYPANESQMSNFLLISVGGAKFPIFGAYFRTVGPPQIPMPKSTPPIDLSKLPNHIKMQLQQLPPEHRARLLRELSMKQQRLALQQQQNMQMQNQAGPSHQPMLGMGGQNPDFGFGNPSLGANNMISAMNMPSSGMQRVPSNLSNASQGGLGFNPTMFFAQGQAQSLNAGGVQPNFVMGMAANMGMGVGTGMGQNLGMAGGMLQQQFSTGDTGFDQGAVSYEMLQSFMQRNVDSAGGGGGS